MTRGCQSSPLLLSSLDAMLESQKQEQGICCYLECCEREEQMEMNGQIITQCPKHLLSKAWRGVNKRLLILTIIIKGLKLR